MKRLDSIIKSKLVAALLIVSVAVVGVGLTRFGFAAPGSMYVTPTPVSVVNGNSFTVSIRLNPGGPVDSVDATLSYDASKLQFISVSSSGSSFPGSVAESGGGGSVNTARFIGGGGSMSTDGLIVQVTFKALASSGSATLSLAGSNAAYNGAYTSPTLTSGTVNFTAPSTPPPPPPPVTKTPTPKTPSPSKPGTTPTPSPTPTTPGASPTPAPTPTPTTPAAVVTACNAKATTVQFTVATLRVTCSPAARAFIKYGTDGKLVAATTPSAAAAPEFDTPLAGAVIKPGTAITYSVVTVDAAGTQTESTAQTFTTKGYTVKIKALDKKQKPLSNQSFILHSTPMTSKSGTDGTVTFINVAPGKHSLELSQGKNKSAQDITVEDLMAVTSDGTQYAGVQNYSVAFNKASSSNVFLRALVLILLVLVLVGAALWLFVIKKNGGPTPPWVSNVKKKLFKGPKSGTGSVDTTAQPVALPQLIVPNAPPSPPEPEQKDTTPHVG